MMDKVLVLLDRLKTFPRWGAFSIVGFVISAALALIHTKWTDVAQAIRFLFTIGLPK